MTNNREKMAHPVKWIKICVNLTTNVCGIATTDLIEGIKTTGKGSKMISLNSIYERRLINEWCSSMVLK